VSDIAWEISHSVDANVSLSFAWAYMTNVANWDDPPAAFELDGPFATGSLGTTRVPGQEPRHWKILEVNPLESYVLETQLDRAAMTFEWRFDRLAGGKTRLTQHIVLKGENSRAYMAVQSAFRSGLPAGMSRIALAIERANAERCNAGT
jgi:hypothetical protein